MKLLIALVITVMSGTYLAFFVTAFMLASSGSTPETRFVLAMCGLAVMPCVYATWRSWTAWSPQVLKYRDTFN